MNTEIPYVPFLNHHQRNYSIVDFLSVQKKMFQAGEKQKITFILCCVCSNSVITTMLALLVSFK